MSDKTASAKLWMPVFIKDHKAFASTLSHLEHSAYTYLRFHLWMNEGSIIDDDKSIARELRLSVAQWKKIRGVLLAQCTIQGGRIFDPEIASEVDKAKANISQKSKAGKASAEARRLQREGNGCSTGVATAEQPRAGGGVGDGLDNHYHDKRTEGDSARVTARGWPRVIDGGAKCAPRPSTCSVRRPIRNRFARISKPR